MRWIIAYLATVAVLLIPASASAGTLPAAGQEALVEVLGYDGDLMEPFLTRDGTYLMFNNRNHPPEQTDLHLARAVDPTTFRYLGPMQDLNTSDLDGVPSVDDAGVMYWTSVEQYQARFLSIKHGTFREGAAEEDGLVEGLARAPGWVQFDAEISADGRTLYVSEGWFASGEVEHADIFVARRKGEAFQADRGAAMLAAVNSDALEYAPALTRDERTLFFTRWDGAGLPAIWRAERASRDVAFGTPERLPLKGFVEAATVSADETHIYFHRRMLPGTQHRLFVYGVGTQ